MEATARTAAATATDRPGAGGPDGAPKASGAPLRAIPSPLAIFIRTLAIMCVAEAATMLALPRLLDHVPEILFAVIDDAVLVLVSAPFLWWFVVRPLRGAALQERARAATVVAHARDAIITVDEHGAVESFNPAAEEMFGYAAEEVLGRPITALVAAPYRDAGRASAHETSGLRKDGGKFPVELSLATWQAPDGTFRTAIVRDVTERKRADEAVRARTAQLEVARAVAAEITRELEISVVLDLITRRAAELLSVKNGSVLLWDERTRQLRPRTWHGFGGRLDAVDIGLGHGFARTVAEQRHGGIVPDAETGIATLALVGQPLLYRDRLLGVIIVGNLGTDRRFTEQDLQLLGLFADQAAIAIENARLYEEVQSLAVVRERQRIAREMHDSLAQTLSLLHLQLRRARDEHDHADTALTHLLGDMTAVAGDAYDDVRRSIFDLRTAGSGGKDWVPSLTDYLHGFGARTGIVVELDTADTLPGHLPPATEVQLIRIVQEALANVHRHARAENARVRLEADAQWLRVTIEDDGQGFTPGALPTSADQFGLATMRERAESLGGRLEIDCAPGRGTVIVATLPLLPSHD